jgi:hypothetical protein
VLGGATEVEDLFVGTLNVGNLFKAGVKTKFAVLNECDSSFVGEVASMMTFSPNFSFFISSQCYPLSELVHFRMLKLFVLITIITFSGAVSSTYKKFIYTMFQRSIMRKFVASAVSLSVFISLDNNNNNAMAVSGGGKDYATKDIREQDFSNQNLVSKDFTQCDASKAIFSGAKLNGARFYRANLKNADFSNADLSGASLEDTLLVDSIFDNALLEGAYLSNSIADAKSLIGADFTDSLIPQSAKGSICKRTDIGKPNSKTGVITSESLACD